LAAPDFQNESMISVFSLRLPPTAGGMERQTLIQSLELQKHEKTAVYSVSADPSQITGLKRLYCTREYNGIASKEINALNIFFRAILSKDFWNSEIIYIHQFNILAWFLILLCRWRNVKIFCKIANTGLRFDLRTFFDRYSILRFTVKFLRAKKIKFLILSPSVREEFRQYGVSDNQIINFRNGVVVKRGFRVQNSSTNKVLFVGRIEPIKRVDLILKLAARLENFQFDCYGGGSLIQAMLSEVNSMGLTNLKFHGEVSNSDISYEEYDWLILPSIAEGMSNAVLEGIAASVGIVARDIPANEFISALTKKYYLFKEEQLDDVVLNLTECKKSGKPTHMFDTYDIRSVVKDFLILCQHET
jgi:glycosyltransferase involved in cell wall biosynthesis